MSAIDRRIIELYHEYAHRPLARRVFLRRLAGIPGGSAAASALLVGCVGFCWGGGMANQLAAHSARLAAAAPFYGPGADPADVPRIKALLLHYAEHDSWVNPGIAAYGAALKAAGVSYTTYTYPGTDHAFHNDTAGVRYNREAAELAWKRTVEFFRRNLGR